jgi:hypothetical protein
MKKKLIKMPKYRVFFRRTVSSDLYLDVEASNETEAIDVANELTLESDDCLTEIPESYEYTTGLSGEVQSLEGEEVED